MDRYLVDTHIFLWWLNGDKRLKSRVKKVIENNNNHICVSIASLWEISIKHKAGKLLLKTTIPEMVSLAGFYVIPITLPHILELETLLPHHRDPFDRMLIAQAQAENLTLISNDPKMTKYNIKIFS